MNIFNRLKNDVISLASSFCSDYRLLAQTSIEIPKDPLNGDLSTNIAMIIAANIRTNPREVGLKLRELLITLPYIAHIEIASGGFINFTLRAEVWHESITNILSAEQDFTELDIGQGEKINIEYVSANPTGPMHIGHARGAIYGDSLARLLAKCGYKIVKEFYINDAGAQIHTLAESAMLRYEEALTSKPVEIPQGLYPGEYLIEVGQKLSARYGNQLINMDRDQAFNIVKKFTVDEMMSLIKSDLNDLDIEHEVFFSESQLHNGAIDDAVDELTSQGLIYKGTLPPPKGKIDDEWEERTLTLFKSTQFGDDQDRPVKKSNGSWAYIAPEIAYVHNKINRGFNNLIFVLGADHAGYVKRLEAITKALSNNKVGCAVKICQLVNFVSDGVPIKMSKRSGNFLTVRDVIDEVGKDILRFIMLTRKNDAPLDFDLEKVKEQSKENPVFYVQYAHVRTVSIIANISEHLKEAHDKFINNNFNLSLLTTEEEIEIIKLLTSWSKILESAARTYEPHRIAFYLLNIAAKFHALWNMGKENNHYRFMMDDNIELTAARLALVKAIQKIIKNGLDIMGVTPLNKM